MAKRTSRKKRRKRILRLSLVVLVAAVLVGSLIVGLVSCDRDREPPAPAGDALWDGGWYEDELGRIGRDRPLVKGMKTFEQRTGVKPYLSLTDGVEPQEVEDFAREQYGALFEEGAHLLVVYDEWGEGTYYLAAQTGPDSPLADEQRALVLSCLEKAYSDPANKTYAAAFGAGFAAAAEALAPARQADGVGLLLGMGLLMILMSVGLILFLRKRARQAKD